MYPNALRNKVLVLVLMLARHATAWTRACEESGYCSTGISKHWIGDIMESSQFRAMLEAVTYKKELVLSIFQESNGDELWVDQALQLHFELEDMGYAHHIFVTDGNSSCAKLNSQQQISCVWDSSELPWYVLGGEVKLWHNRWKLIARASRIGYNVMSIDTDFMWFRDPYIHFKGVFKDIQMLGVPEGGSVYNNNGGFMYVQNVRPDGPVSWVFKQVAMSTLRRADDDFKYMEKWTNQQRQNCLTFDQSIISDALEAAAVGRMIFTATMRSCKQKGSFLTRAGNELTPQQALSNSEALVAPHTRIRFKHVRPDKEWLDKLGVKFVSDFDSQLHYGNITVPNLNWGYAEELGGRFAPLEPGPLSAAFTKQLQADCPDCPWWPERRPLPPGEDPLSSLLGPKFDSPQITKQNAWAYWDKDVPQETHCQVPAWLACSLANVRRGWVLGKNAPLQGAMVLGHVHAWHMQTHRAHKAMIRKVFGRYNWTLGSRVAKDAGLPNPYGLRRAVKKLIGLSPNMDLSRTRSWEEFSSIMVGLIQVAVLSDRQILMPHLPCQTAWLHQPDMLKDKEAAPKLCVAPTFWRTPYSFPMPVTVAVDERGELIGGWARRLRALYGVNASTQPIIPPLIFRPESTLEDQASGSGSGAWGAGGPRRALADSGPEIPEDWWEKQRYVEVMPQLWDPSCTKDLHAIIYPELFHWLKNDEVGKTVDSALLKSTTANTVFTLSPTAEALKLRPPPPPGGDSAAVPAGSVVPTSKEPGWSLYDVQAALPVAEVMEHVKQFDSQPLVYIDHPVMVVHTTTDPAKEKEMYAEDARVTEAGKGHALIKHRASGGDGPMPMVNPDQAITAINHWIRKRKCKAIWIHAETHDGVPVTLNHGLPSVLVNGLIQPAPTQQATA